MGIPPSRIDELLPDPDFRAAYEISIKAPAPLVYQRLLAADFHASPVVRLLMSLRTGKRIRSNGVPRDLRQRFTGSGFVVLAEAPGEELVIGVVGKFWRPDGGRHLDLRADDFIGFSHRGEAKVAMNFKVRQASDDETILSTETRIKCFGWAATRKFRMYWGLVGPFSGLIRRVILKQIKADSEGRHASPTRRAQ